jgi:hypothetical protein
VDASRFESRLVEGRKTREQVLFEAVLAAAISADRQGLVSFSVLWLIVVLRRLIILI